MVKMYTKVSVFESDVVMLLAIISGFSTVFQNEKRCTILPDYKNNTHSLKKIYKKREK